MLTPAFLTLLVGMLLGQRFKVLILVPSILIILMFAIGAMIAGVAPGTVALTATAAIACLQIGYLVGTGLHYLWLTVRENRLRRPVNSRPARAAR
ncbi:MAG TPA: hypothetical protein VEK74_13560 [Burkholderiaceae bacterium]|nr:hypothetical protein [Burkholderiaceae bacterium]